MSLTRKIAHNIIIQIIEKAICLVLGLAMVAIMTRYLGRMGFGQFTTVTAFLQMFAILTDMGLYLILVQMSSHPEANIPKIVNNIFTLKFFLSFFLLGLAPLIAIFIPGYSPIIKIGIAIAALSFFFQSMIQLLSAIFQKNLCMEKIAIADVAGKLLLLVSVFIIVSLKGGLLMILGAVVLGSLTNFSLVYFFARRFVKIAFRFDFSFWKEVLSKSWPIALSVAFTLIYFKTDTFILSLVRSQEEVGIYGVAYRVLEILIMMPALFIGLVMPVLANSWAAKDNARFKRVMQKSFDFLIMLAVPIVVGTLFLAQSIVILIAGSEFIISGTVLKILIFAVGTIFLGSLFTHTAVAIEKQKTIFWFYMMTAVLALTGYLIFIPKYSYYGAAGMTVFAELLIACSGFFIIWRYAKFFPSLKMLFKSLAASAVMGLCLYVLAGYNLFLLIFVAGFVYFIIMYLLKGINKEIIKDIVKIKSE